MYIGRKWVQATFFFGKRLKGVLNVEQDTGIKLKADAEIALNQVNCTKFIPNRLDVSNKDRSH